MISRDSPDSRKTFNSSISFPDVLLMRLEDRSELGKLTLSSCDREIID
jgi:hypothetical protein